MMQGQLSGYPIYEDGSSPLAWVQRLRSAAMARGGARVTDAGLDIAEVLATVDAGTLDEVTLAQAVQIRGIVNLKGTAE